ncbi:MAG TPA: hypothetical protein VK971_00450 [Thiohalobacter sp.]|nr:hypothetical protein [Thiohalobacter sp.]
MTDPHHMLARWRAALEAGLPPPRDVSDWLLEGLGRFEAAEGRLPLCRFLRLRGPGVRSLAYKRQREVMLAALRRALVLLDCPNPHRACQHLANRLGMFEARTWPRIQDCVDPPDRLDAVERELFAAFQSGLEVPCSQRQLYRELVEKR